MIFCTCYLLIVCWRLFLCLRDCQLSATILLSKRTWAIIDVTFNHAPALLNGALIDLWELVKWLFTTQLVLCKYWCNLLILALLLFNWPDTIGSSGRIRRWMRLIILFKKFRVIRRSHVRNEPRKFCCLAYIRGLRVVARFLLSSDCLFWHSPHLWWGDYWRSVLLLLITTEVGPPVEFFWLS